MSNCSNHRKDLFGQNDMQHVAEDIGNLHYETFSHLLKHLSKKLKEDSRKDWAAGRIQIANRLKTASDNIKKAFVSINEAWEISKPFMDKSKSTSRAIKEIRELGTAWNDVICVCRGLAKDNPCEINCKEFHDESLTNSHNEKNQIT